MKKFAVIRSRFIRKNIKLTKGKLHPGNVSNQINSAKLEDSILQNSEVFH